MLSKLLVVLSIMVIVAPFGAPAYAQTVLVDHFAGVTLDASLQGGLNTGDPVLLSGTVSDAAITQILFRFTPDSEGDPVPFFLDVSMGRFDRSVLFDHSQADVYTLDVFAGQRGGSLPFVGSSSDFVVNQGSGAIWLPEKYFASLTLDDRLATELTSGQGLTVAGSLDVDVTLILFSFVPGSADSVPVEFFFAVTDGRFERVLLFDHSQSGAYLLEVFAGQQGGSLSFLGSFAPIQIDQGEGVIVIPEEFFGGFTLEQGFPNELQTDGVFPFAGTVDADVVGLRIDILSLTDGVTRSVDVGIEADGSFRLPLRLLPRELGDLSFIAIVELANGELRRSGEFAIRGVDPPGPDLEVGALALSLLPGGTGTVPLANRGELPLELGTVQVVGPFEVMVQPTAIPPGERGELVVAYGGGGGDDGTLTIFSDDPVRPRVRVALEGLADDGVGREEGALQRLRTDSDGFLSISWDFSDRDLVLALYSARVVGADPDAVYSYSVGASESLGKPSGVGGSAFVGKLAASADDDGEPSTARRFRLEGMLRQREGELARGIRELGWRAAKPAQVRYQEGDQTSLLFPEWPTVPGQAIAATVVAVNDRVVAFAQDDLRASGTNINGTQIQMIIDQFGEDYDEVVRLFGTPSDVDGDGKIAFLFTHLVDDVGLGGFYNAESVLPVEDGGGGDLTDLVFLSPTQGLSTYRSLLVHEFQHLVSFNQHVLVRSGEAEVSWLNEGLSHLSEDLVDDGFVTGGVARLVDAFLAEPWATGLGGDAGFDSRKRGASYLFVRSLVDRLGEGVVRRLVQTGLADRDNVEEAAGERFEDLLASWAAQLFASGNGLVGHRRLNYEFEFLSTKGGRGFRQPATLAYRLDDPRLVGSLRPRGVSFVRVTGEGEGRVDIQTDPEAQVGLVALPVPRDFAAPIRLPVRLFAGMTLGYPMPALARVADELTVAGSLDNTSSTQVLFRLARELAHESGVDTLRFFSDVESGRFELTLSFAAAAVGSYTLEVFAGESGQGLSFLGRYEPFEVLAADASLPSRITAVSESSSVPARFDLGQNYPNPFNAATIIDFEMPRPGVVRLEVRSVSGQLVEVLADGWRASGRHSVAWRARGRGTGVYFYRLLGEEFRETRKMVLVQ